MEIKTYVLGAVRTNCYLVINEETREVVIIDAADNASLLIEAIKEDNLKPVGILLTHGHFDHIMAAREVAKCFEIPVYAFEQEKELLMDSNMNGAFMIRSKFTIVPDLVFNDKDILELGGMQLQVIHTPGHTMGSACFYLKQDRILFSGDTLFLESVGRTDLPTGDTLTIIKSVQEKLMVLPEDVIVYPGHGDITTIGHEKNHNPYVTEDNF